MARGGRSAAAMSNHARKRERHRAHRRRDRSPPRGVAADPRPHGGVTVNVRCSRTGAEKGSSSRRGRKPARHSYYSLLRLKQGPGEPLREYVRCFRREQRKVHDLPDASVIGAFYEGVRSISIREELAVRWVHTVAELYSLAHRCAQAEKTGVSTGAGRRGHPHTPTGVDKRGRRGKESKKEPFILKVTLNEDGSRSVLVGSDMPEE